MSLTQVFFDCLVGEIVYRAARPHSRGAALSKIDVHCIPHGLELMRVFGQRLFYPLYWEAITIVRVCGGKIE